jgi:hypothetical protein
MPPQKALNCILVLCRSGFPIYTFLFDSHVPYHNGEDGSVMVQNPPVCPLEEALISIGIPGMGSENPRRCFPSLRTLLPVLGAEPASISDT